MRDYTNNNPIFSEVLKITETSDPARADIVNTAPIQIFQNTLCNRRSIEQLKQSAVSTEDYDPEVSYPVGDYCLYQNTLYKCVKETTGDWDPSCWHKTSALEEIDGLKRTMAQQTALNELYQQMTSYTDQQIADLVGGASTTLNTIGKISAALQNNPEVVTALEAAIGEKANEAEFDSHKRETESLLGNADLSGIGDGTVTGAIIAIFAALGGVKLVFKTQQEYDALGSGRPSDTVYIIVG